ncbi:MAG: A24 family peptidase [Oscillospiraceae bacterium]|jgi:prepilin signal peptidase PulO-like enzyme (type II secretory pathway)|nr:A24 family peptidase [Oscillospiraceae bacterium]
MASFVIPLICAAAGALCGAACQPIFNRLPETWLQDYDYDPNSGNARPAKRMKFFPHTLILIPVTAVLFFFGALFNPAFFERPELLRILLMFLPALPLSVVVISDHLNRIIPDHVVVFTAILAIFGFSSDLLYGSLWFPAGAPFWHPILNRVLGGVIGAALLFLIGWIGSWVSKKDAMGHGDIKFLLACGLLSGAYGLIFVLFISFIIGGIAAVPLLIRKRVRIAREEREIRESKNPAKARKILERKKREISFVDDPDYIAFGPFLAIGTLCFLIFETPVFKYFSDNILPALELMFK